MEDIEDGGGVEDEDGLAEGSAPMHEVSDPLLITTEAGSRFDAVTNACISYGPAGTLTSQGYENRSALMFTAINSVGGTNIGDDDESGLGRMLYITLKLSCWGGPL